MLCDYCRQAEEEWEYPPIPEIAMHNLRHLLPFIVIPPVYHHTTPVELKQCAEEGNCPFCKLIYQDILESTSIGFGDLPQERISLVRFGADDGSGTNPGIEIQIGGRRRGALDIYPMNDKFGDLLIECARMEDKSTTSDACFKIASTWVNQCLSSHQNCIQYQGGEPELPTRVVGVGPPDGSVEPFLHVNPGTEKGRYLALSHRWGGSEALEKSKTMSSHCLENRPLPFKDLPLTFQHAVQITRRFHYRYLWIDSLCIIQDDEADWNNESIKMASIYRRADFTIATIDAESADSGCFFQRDGLSARPCRVNIYRPPEEFDVFSGIPGKMFVCPRVPNDNWRSNYRRFASLDGRGWCLQERVLSTRVLSFGKDGIYWECVTQDACEKMIEGRNTDVLSTSREYIRVLKELAGGIARGYRADFRDTHRAWHLLVEDYTRRSLTFEADKLVAISGIVENLADKKEDICRAGAWEKHLWRDLMWLVVLKTTLPKAFESSGGILPPYGEPGHRLSTKIAPTWSWASIDAHISFQTSLGDDSKTYDVKSEFNFGPIIPECNQPSIIAEGILIETKPCKCGGTCDPEYEEGLRQSHSLENKLEHLVHPKDGKRLADFFPDEKELTASAVFYLPIASAGGTARCIVLVPVEGMEGKYRRVGLAHDLTRERAWKNEPVQNIIIV